MRANCLHVDFPVRVLHGGIVRDCKEQERDFHVRGHGDFGVCLHGVHERDLLGATQRQGRAEEGAAGRPIWHRIEHAAVWVR